MPDPERQRVAVDRAGPAGYSRAVRVGDTVHVAGTTAVQPDGSIGCLGDPAGQARLVFASIESALAEVGGRLDDVVRTRMFVSDLTRWQEVSDVHAEVFANIRPAASLIGVVGFVSPEVLVEIEVDAELPRSAPPGQ